MSDIHVIPHADLVGHEANDDCACGPDFQFRDGHTIAVHQSLDGRERRWWSDMDEDELVETLTRISGQQVEEAWTEEPHGPAFARFYDGAVFRFYGDGNVVAWEPVMPEEDD